MLYALFLLAEGAKQPEPPMWVQFFPFILLAILFYFMFIVPGRKERQHRQHLINALKKNDEVLTSAGIYGVVVNIKEKEDEVTLKIDDNARLRVLKSSIVRITNAKEAPKESS